MNLRNILYACIVLFIVALNINGCVARDIDSDHDRIPDHLEYKLAKRFVPILRFDSEERYYPICIEAYTDYSILENKSIDGDEYKPVFISTDKYQKDYTVEYGVGTSRRDINKEILEWILMHPAYYRLNIVMPRDGTYDDVHPLFGNDEYEQIQDLMRENCYDFNVTYVNVVPFRLYNKTSNQYEEFIGIQYWFAYIFNAHPNPIVPDHEFDWEHVTVVLNKSTTKPVWVILSQHWWKEYRYWDEMERIGSHPIIYVAKGSHASYRNSGVSIIGDIKDDHDGDGAEITPGIRLILNPLWIRFPGDWGESMEGWLHWRLDVIHEDILPVKGETSEIVGGDLQDFIENNYMINETVELDEKLDTHITINAPSVASEGQKITISGQLISEDGKPISYALIRIYDKDIGGDDLLSWGFTDEYGYYKVTWNVSKVDIDDTIELYAKFDGKYNFNSNESTVIHLTIY